MMISAAQLRAARGLLDWTRSELAKASGVSAETIKNIEHGIYAPQETTVGAIAKAFSEHNVEFTESDGVRKNANIIINYQGIADFRKYADDIYQVLLQNPKDRQILIFGNNDQEFLEALGDYAQIHMKRMSKLENLDFRALVLEGMDVIVTKYIQYRRLENMAFAIPFSVYSNRFDFIMYGRGDTYPRVVVIKSKAVADAYREQFEVFWKNSKKVTS